MPVFFYVDPDFLDDRSPASPTLTLSYTFSARATSIVALGAK